MKIKTSNHSSESFNHTSSKADRSDKPERGRGNSPAGLQNQSSTAKANNPSIRLSKDAFNTPNVDTANRTDSAGHSAKGFFRRVRDSVSGIIRKPDLPGPLGNIPLPNPVVPRPGAIIDRVQDTIEGNSIPKPGLSAGDIKKMRGTIAVLRNRIEQVKKEIDRATESRGKAPALLVDRLQRLEQKSDQLTRALP